MGMFDARQNPSRSMGQLGTSVAGTGWATWRALSAGRVPNERRAFLLMSPMDGRKPTHGNEPSAATPPPRGVIATLLVLGVSVAASFLLNVRTASRAPGATSTLTSSHNDSRSRATRDQEVMPRPESVLPARAEESESGCRAALRAAGVAYESVPRAAAGSIPWPIVLAGPVDGVRIRGSGKADAPTNYLDCRLASALLAWAPMLRAKGVVGLEHYSMYRPESVVANSNKPSGHSLGWAIDVAKFELGDGRVLSVLDDWKNRARGADPCRSWPDDEAGRLMRQLVCEAAARGLFYTVVTPHHNDAHGNHVHLEIDPQKGSLWIH